MRLLPAVLQPHAKAVLPLIVGVLLVILAALLGDDTLRELGLGAIGASPLVWAASNQPT